MSEVFAIAADGLSAKIDSLGAELLSLTDGEGREYMTDADPRWWTGHAPLLFPIVGRLKGNAYRLDGRTYSLAKHGFARKRPFACVDQDRRGGRARFLLEADAETLESYPFRFELDVLFEIAGLTLTLTATVRNRDSRPMPFSFGFHPAFAWPLPGGGRKEAHRIVFAQDEPEPIRRIDPASALLLPEPEPTPVTGRVLAPRAALFEKDALIWDRLNSRSVAFAGEGAALEIAFPDCPHLGIWQKPGAPFLAIEPWHGFNDPAGFAGDFGDKPGVIELAAGADRAFRLHVTVRPVQPAE
jgi:galactose mutarotase-like enzyme